MSLLALDSILHDCWQTLSVGLSILILVAEGLWLSTGRAVYLTHARYWSRLLAIDIAIALGSSIPMAFELCGRDAGVARSVCMLRGIEPGAGCAIAALLQLGFLGIMLYGWNRLSRGAHLLATGMVAINSTLAAFWSIAADAAARSPHVANHIDMGQSMMLYAKVIFGMGMERSIPYLWLDAIANSLVVIGGVSAWKMLRREQRVLFGRSFRSAAALLLVIAAVHALVTKSSEMAILSTGPLRIANGVNAWLLVLAVWTASSTMHPYRRLGRRLAERRLLLAWVVAMPLPFVGTACTWFARMTESVPGLPGRSEIGLIHARAGSGLDAAFQAILVVIFLWSTSRWFSGGAEAAMTPARRQTPAR